MTKQSPALVEAMRPLTTGAARAIEAAGIFSLAELRGRMEEGQAFRASLPAGDAGQIDSLLKTPEASAAIATGRDLPRRDERGDFVRLDRFAAAALPAFLSKAKTGADASTKAAKEAWAQARMMVEADHDD